MIKLLYINLRLVKSGLYLNRTRTNAQTKLQNEQSNHLESTQDLKLTI